MARATDPLRLKVISGVKTRDSPQTLPALRVISIQLSSHFPEAAPIAIATLWSLPK